MGFVTVERRGGAAVVTYANPPLGTMTAAGAQEMLDKSGRWPRTPRCARSC